MHNELKHFFNTCNFNLDTLTKGAISNAAQEKLVEIIYNIPNGRGSVGTDHVFERTGDCLYILGDRGELGDKEINISTLACVGQLSAAL